LSSGDVIEMNMLVVMW